MINKQELLKLIDTQFPLVKKDIGDMSKVKISPMKFEIEQYEAKGLGNVSFMSASGLFGLMKMDTMIINPFELDAPLHSYDYISATGNITLLEDLFDTRIEKAEFADSLKSVISTYSNLDKAVVESKWYDTIRLPQSLFIKGKKKDSSKFDQIVKEYTSAYLTDCAKCKPCDRNEKMYASQVYTEGLLNNGGPSTDIFVKKKGLEYTQRLFREILFATKNLNKGEIKMSSFKDLRIVDNFYQTSSFFPMPTVCISTVNDDGSLNIGSYSLCFPYYIAGKSRYAMVLECRNTSNTAHNIMRRGKCAINFIPDDKKYFKEAVRFGFPGPSNEKMSSNIFTMEKGQADPDDENRPTVISESFQVFECTWAKELEGADKFNVDDIDDGYPGPYNDFNGITSKYGCHFVLYIDKILMKDKYYSAIVNGVKKDSFPPVPVDYGYRDSTNFWYTTFPRLKKPVAEPIPAPKEVDLASIRFAADRCDDKIRFTDAALKNFVKVPRPFLKTVLNGCIDWARENGVTLIDDEHVKIINDKRRQEKNK